MAPAPVNAPKLNETWPVTPAALTRFAFGVPDDLKEFESARVVLVPTATASGTYSLKLMVKRDSELSSMFDVVEEANLPVAVNADVVTELDVSTLFHGVFDGTSAGNDYVSLILQGSSGIQSSARVLGLRFVYDIKDESILSIDVKNGSLTGDDVDTNTLEAVHMIDEAGVAYAGGAQSKSLDPHAEMVRSIEVNAPADGHVVVTATGFFGISTNTAGARCGLRADTAPTIPPDHIVAGRAGNVPFAITKGFPVKAGIATTFQLVCQRVSSSAAEVRNVSMTAIFSPTLY